MTSNHIYRLFLPANLFLVFCNLKFSGSQFFNCRKIVVKVSPGDIIHQCYFLSSFLTWSTWTITSCAKAIRWSREMAITVKFGDIIFKYVFPKKHFELTDLAWNPLPPKSVKFSQESRFQRGSLVTFNHFVVSKVLNIASFAWSSSRVKAFMMFFRFHYGACFFIMVFTLDHVKSLLERNSVYQLKYAQSLISARFQKPPFQWKTEIEKTSPFWEIEKASPSWECKKTCPLQKKPTRGKLYEFITVGHKYC